MIGLEAYGCLILAGMQQARLSSVEEVVEAEAVLDTDVVYSKPEKDDAEAIIDLSKPEVQDAEIVDEDD